MPESSVGLNRRSAAFSPSTASAEKPDATPFGSLPLVGLPSLAPILLSDTLLSILAEPSPPTGPFLFRFEWDEEAQLHNGRLMAAHNWDLAAIIEKIPSIHLSFTVLKCYRRNPPCTEIVTSRHKLADHIMKKDFATSNSTEELAKLFRNHPTSPRSMESSRNWY